MTFTVDAGAGYAYVLPQDAPQVDAATTVRGHYRALPLVQPHVRITHTKESGDRLLVTVQSDVYVPVAYLKTIDDRTHLSDNYFELLPGVPRVIALPKEEGKGVKALALPIQPKSKE